MPLSTSRVPDTDSTAALYRQRPQARIVTAFLALASVIMLSVGMTMGQGQARAAVLPTSVPSATGTLGNLLAVLANNGLTQGLADQWRFELCSSDSDGGPKNGGADCTGSTGAGVAVVLPSKVDLVPDAVYQPAQGIFNAAYNAGLDLNNDGKILGITVPVPNAAIADGSARVIGDGFQFALASGGGEAVAISYLPLSLATAGASDGRKAYAFAVIGMANAWTTSAIPVEIFTVPVGSIPAIQHVSCYGVVTAAYAENVGACANIAGTFDFQLDLLQSIPQIQFALTDPSAVVFDPAEVLATALGKLFAGEGFTLSKDFVRLSIGGDSLLALTSGYGLSAPVTIDWLGSQITLYSTANINGEDRPNFFALPVIEFGTFDATQIIPTISIPQIDFPFGLESAGPYDTASTTVAARALTVVDPTADAVSVTPESIGTAARVGSDDSDDAESGSDPTTSSATETTTTSETGTTEADATATDTTETGTTGTGTTGTGAADASPKTTGASGAGDTTSSGGADTAADDDDSSDAETPAVTSAE